MHPNWRTAGRLLAVAAIGAVVSVGFAAPASAHVTVNPREAVQGGFGRLAFRVPTESDTSSTTKVEVHMPEDAPVGSVSTMPVAGWTVTVQRRTLDKPLDVHGSQIKEVVSVITWTATGDAAIKPGQFQEFPVSMGPLPTVDKMVFKALQTYSDGTVVRWIEPPATGGSEPDNPAPVLTLTKPASAGAAPAGNAQAGAADAGTAAGNGSGPSPDRTGTWLGLTGLVAGLGGLVLGGLAFLRTRRT